ncbi:MAG: hypothetical protein ACJASR_002186 [Psychroserpens sp.]|jgi:hypothetical protein
MQEIKSKSSSMFILLIGISFCFLTLGCSEKKDMKVEYYNDQTIKLKKYVINDTVFEEGFYQNGFKKFFKYTLGNQKHDSYYSNLIENQLLREIYLLNDTVRKGMKFDESNRLVDSLVSKDLDINILRNKDDYFLGDTASFKVFISNRSYDSQYLDLLESLEGLSLFSHENFNSYKGYIELSFLCDELGKNTIQGIFYNTSIKVTEEISASEFYGYRYGVFDYFKYDYVVQDNKN